MSGQNVFAVLPIDVSEMFDTISTLMQPTTTDAVSTTEAVSTDADSIEAVISEAGTTEADTTEAVPEVQMCDIVSSDCTMNPDEQQEIALAYGYYKIWYGKNGSKQSIAKENAETTIVKSTLRLTALALLTSIDEMLSQAKKDSSFYILLTAVSRTPFVRMARETLRLEPNPLTDIVHYVFVKREEFNPRVNLSPVERHGLIGVASIWTLIKWFYAQWCAAVNLCYGSHLNDLPLGKFVAHEEQRGKRGVKRETTSRYPENATWGERKNKQSSQELVVILYDIMEVYNELLGSSPDLSEAYNCFGETRRARREIANVQYAKNQADYEARRQERASNPNPQKNYMPRGQGRTQTKFSF